MFKTEFERLCTERKTSPTAVCLAIGLSNSAYTQWTYTSVPRKTTLMKIERHLSLPDKYFESFLRETKKESTVIPNDALNPQIHKIIRLLETTNIPDDVIDFIYNALENYKR